MKHVHYDAIVAWANGDIIECLAGTEWAIINNPKWQTDIQYRVQLKPKPPVVHEVLVSLSPFAGPVLHAASTLEANCVLVFDGHTGKLKQCTFKGA